MGDLHGIGTALVTPVVVSTTEVPSMTRVCIGGIVAGTSAWQIPPHEGSVQVPPAWRPEQQGPVQQKPPVITQPSQVQLLVTVPLAQGSGQRGLGTPEQSRTW